MPAKKAAKPVTEPSEPEDRPTPLEADDGPQDAPGRFHRNYLYPILGGLATALIPVLTTELPTRFGDGVQPGDWAAIGATVGAAALGYFLTILQRHGGAREPWTQKPQ